MLIEVFQYLDGKTVKEATLVCKEWNRVIGAALNVMKKFTLVIDFKKMNHRKLDQLTSSKRHYTSAAIDFWVGEESELIQVVERFGKELTNLWLRCRKWTVRTTLQVLENTPELEKLEIYLLNRKVDDISKGSVSLMKLKKLTISNEWDFSMIKAPMLQELVAFRVDEDPEIFEKFLKASPKIEYLSILQASVLEEIDCNFPFELKYLQVDGILDFNDSVKQFLLSQAATLEIFEGYDCRDPKLLKLVLAEFKKLKSLTADFSVLGASAENLKPMPALKKLCCFPFGFSSEIAMRAVLGNCPELEKLEVDSLVFLDIDFIESSLEFIANNNKKLQFLSMSAPELSSARFQHLQTLELKYVYVCDIDSLVIFLRENPTIQSLSIRKISQRENIENIGELIVGTSLKHVEINSDKEKLNEICNMFKSRFGASKSIELELSSESLKISI